MRVMLNKLIKIVSLTIAIILAASLIPPITVTKADEMASGTCGDNLTWTLDSEGTLIISGYGEMEGGPWSSYKEDIYSAIVEYGVLSISDYAFFGCTNLESITIPESVTSIGNFAFQQCSSLAAIALPESVISLGKYSFCDCSSLTSADISINVNSIGIGAFSGCISLTSIIIPNNVNALNGDVFAGCSSLILVDIPESITSIGEGAFTGCSMLTNIVIPNSVTIIEDYAFQGCSNLESLTIPNSVTNISNTAFLDCSSIGAISVEPENGVYDSRGNCNSIIETETNTVMLGCSNTIIPEDAKSIGAYAFYRCYNLTAAVIPESVESIGEAAFYECSELENIEIPASVIGIGDSAFYGCSNLGTIVIPEGVASLGNFVFDKCYSLTDVVISNGVISIGEGAFCDCWNITSVDIPNSVKSIGNTAFLRCRNLESIEIPKSVTNIGYGAFSGCDALEVITVDPENAIYDSRDYCNAIIETNTNSLIAGCRNTVIPDDVTRIGRSSFSGCIGLDSITIPENVTGIDARAFNGCTGLESITISENVTSIDEYAFSGCISLKSIVIPEGITSIGNSAFSHCGLTSVSIPQSVISLGWDSFNNCQRLQDIYYEGTQEAWEALNIGTGSATLFTSEDRNESLLPEISISEIPGGVSVTITSAGSEIFYTLDGSTPCTASIPYEGTFILDEPSEYFINARAFNLDEGQRSPVSTEYIYLEQSERPEIHERNGQVTITGEGDVYYSLDLAEDPSTSSYKYISPLSFDKRTVIKARCIEAGRAASEVAGYTYYAGSSSGLTFPEESYSFENTKQSFGYKGFAYRIPEERYREIFGNSVGEFLYDEYGADAWGGSCFGMASTSILFHKGMLNLDDYSDEAGAVYDLLAPSSSDSMLTQLIERYQISQFLPEVMEERGDISDGGNMVINGLSGNETEAEALLDAVRSGLSGGDPVILIVWRQDLAGSHAVVPYKVEDGKIYVYDCNRPGTERYITYRTNSNGSYSFGFDEYSYAVSYNLFSTLMNGLESSVDIGNAILSSEGEQQMLISIDSTDVTILDMNGNEVDLINYRATEDMETDNTVVCLESGSYRIKNNDSIKTSITVSAATDEDYQTVTVSNPGASIEVKVRNGKVYFCITCEAETDIEASALSSKGYGNSLSLRSTYAEIYSTTDRTVVIRTRASTAVINGEEQELINDESDTGYYFGAAVSPDAESGAGLYREGEQYTLSTDITSLPGEDFNLTVLATGGDENSMLYVASYSTSGRMIVIKGVKMTAGKIRYPFSISKNAAEVKVFMVSADKYIPLINDIVIN